MKFCYSFSWDAFVALINSQFFSSMFGALAGAFAGAVAAHRISISAKKRDDVEAQVRAINTAIMSSFLTCSSLLAFKKQQVASMYVAFNNDKVRFEESLKAPRESGPFHFQMDLELMSLPDVPIENLTRQAHEKIDLGGRPLALVSVLSSTLGLLRTRVEFRNSLIERLRSSFETMSEVERLSHYFGVALPDGSLSKEYADCVDGINSYVNDAIYFASLLVADLQEFGNELRGIYVKRYGDGVDEISTVTFDDPKTKALMPDPSDYEDWAAMFKKKPQKEAKKRWYERFATRWH